MKIEELQLTRDRQALKTAELEKTIEAFTQQRDARDSAAADVASRLGEDVRNLRLALDDTSRRERQVFIHYWRHGVYAASASICLHVPDNSKILRRNLSFTIIFIIIYIYLFIIIIKLIIITQPKADTHLPSHGG